MSEKTKEQIYDAGFQTGLLVGGGIAASLFWIVGVVLMVKIKTGM